MKKYVTHSYIINLTQCMQAKSLVKIYAGAMVSVYPLI